MTSLEIRKKFQEFFRAKNHKLMPSSSLIPKGDPSLLFVNAGMNQFKSWFLGMETPKHPQVVTIQKCLRAGGKHNDLEQVGLTPGHHTFFEMMGNFSFGTYFKKEAIQMSWEFLTQVLQIPEARLWVSVFKEDPESEELWKKEIGLPASRIFKCGEEDNFWRMGDTGPCGPCSEIHYFSGKETKPPLSAMTEIWNLVFMEFHEEASSRKPLPKPCVDTGMGLERLACILQGKASNYQTDLFSPVIKVLEQATGIKYLGDTWSLEEQQVSLRILADHSRAVSQLLADGMLPGAEGASYVLRRILRRAFFYSRKLPGQHLFEQACEQACSSMAEVYPELKKESSNIQKVVREEESGFLRNLKKGEAKLAQKMQELKTSSLSEDLVWELYSTYGFPTDLTRLMAIEQGFKLPKNLQTLIKRKSSSLAKTPKSTGSKSLEESCSASLYFQQRQGVAYLFYRL